LTPRAINEGWLAIGWLAIITPCHIGYITIRRYAVTLLKALPLAGEYAITFITLNITTLVNTLHWRAPPSVGWLSATYTLQPAIAVGQPL